MISFYKSSVNFKKKFKCPCNFYLFSLLSFIFVYIIHTKKRTMKNKIIHIQGIPRRNGRKIYNSCLFFTIHDFEPVTLFFWCMCEPSLKPQSSRFSLLLNILLNCSLIDLFLHLTQVMYICLYLFLKIRK